MSLFGYENPAVPELLELLAEGTSEWTVLVPEGRSLPEVARFFGHREARPGDAWQRGRVRARVLPFTDQDHYDRLLWCCDLNLVRGEDSLVRALWSGRPLLWQPYPQDQGAHLDKLEALLNCAKLGLGAAASESLGALMRAWNGIGSVAASWPVFENALEAQRSAFAGWSEKLAAGPELAASLVRFAELKLK